MSYEQQHSPVQADRHATAQPDQDGPQLPQGITADMAERAADAGATSTSPIG
ncbi:hypothetical protein KIM372_09340 [Bombiscardovia nodaiensis]|uniref:Uncharacterized protein n=1 Tax=Bombiscardovia nodaiensis TaxID=2932181 RepID=A0ABM8B815_9BIFI|nr:hypothetical protein KIM372_09340 [Bombiscardovia nodaiensis]